MKEIRLHLGCQNNYLPGYINVDLPPDAQTVEKTKADLYADVRDLQYETGTVAEVRSHHLLEHFSRQEALLLLARWHRWLRPGGLLVAETPDFEESAKKFLRGSIEEQFLLARHIFGSHEAEWAYHLDFWSEKKFSYVLERLGYGGFRFKKFSNNLEQKVSLLRKLPTEKLEPVLQSFAPLGFNALPNIIFFARKEQAAVNYQQVIRSILSHSLVGREKDILEVWLKDVIGKI